MAADDLERALAFARAFTGRRCDRVERFSYGRARLTPSLPRVWDASGLDIDRLPPGGSPMAALSAEAERLLGAAGLAHRSVESDDPEIGVALAEDPCGIGFAVHRYVVMVAGGAPPSDGRVVELDETQYRAVRAATVRNEPFGDDEETVRQLVEYGLRAALGGSVRRFGVLRGGAPVAVCDLYRSGDVAQIEDVYTLPEHRGRGHARALVGAALAAARAAGSDLVFLVADEDDWPRALYKRLGFEPAGRTYRLLRPPPDALPAGGAT